MTNGFKERDWQMLCSKFGQWEESEFSGPNAMFKAYKRPSAEKVHSWHVYNYEMACCRLVGYPGQQMFSVAGLVLKEGRKFFRTYIGSSSGVRMLEAPYDLLWNNK